MATTIEVIKQWRDQLLREVGKTDQELTERIIDVANTKIAKMETIQTDKNNLPELEEKNFRVNSNRWERYKRGSRFLQGLPFCADYEEYYRNPEGDIVELISTEYKGEQLFTWDAAMRETTKVGKIIPNSQEWELIGDRPDLRIFAGEYYLNYCRGIGYLGSLHEQGRSGKYWARNSFGRNAAWSLCFGRISHVNKFFQEVDYRVVHDLYKIEKGRALSVCCFK